MVQVTPRRVLMMVGNDIRHDTRVLKTALALADGDIEVTILGYSSTGVREQSTLGPVRIVRVPVAWRFRDRANAARKARRDKRLIVVNEPSPREKRLRELQLSLRQREAAEQKGANGANRATRAALWRVAQTKLEQQATRLSKYEDNWRQKLYESIDNSAALVAWRRDIPEIDDYALAFDPVIDSLEWDIIHAHDVHMVGIAARAVARRRANGKEAAWVYDAHEYVAGLSIYPGRPVRKRAAYLDLQNEYIRDADAVVTVTQPLAEQLQKDYDLARQPTVVMNAPVLSAAERSAEVSLREVCGVDKKTPLLVYSGGVTAARGVDTAVRALLALPEVHVAVVCVPRTTTAPVRELTELARTCGVEDRVHFIEPVRPDHVSGFVAEADLGLIPILHFGSHEFALANKLFEYLFAGLPVVVSDTRAQKEFVEREQVGLVHEAGNPASFATVVKEALSRKDEFQKRIRQNTDLLTPYAWEYQEKTLRELYRDLFRRGLPVGKSLMVRANSVAVGDAGISEPQSSSTLEEMVERPISHDDRASYVGFGPANMAGQAWQWAKALERAIPGVSTSVMEVDRGQKFRYPHDTWVETTTYRRDVKWAQALENRAVKDWTHALVEAGRPVFGLRHGHDFVGDVKVLRAAGVRVGLLLHGSEIRNPSINAQQTPWSPFADPADEQTARLQRVVDILAPKVRAFMADEAFGGPVFVSTPDLLRHMPGAYWLPVVVDVQMWSAESAVLDKPVPVVLHTPSRSSLKGSAHVEAAVGPLVEEGLIRYERVEGATQKEMVDLVKGADIVLDQFALGGYGVAACEAMAAGKLVLGHAIEEVREHVKSQTGLEVPVVEAPADRLEAVLREVLTDRDGFSAVAASGPEFVRQVHDGTRSAAVLAERLNIHS
ncbi:lipopolysaccharide 1,2-N-acetylglucosaminetransferase [Dermatophilus congolensis]|uniref:Lipopolysaccharide 1,2-N-acetylglucosaminetransferase n=1 Tax=Dermatophilus congolensis TaxID=1863 RepID=A0AA46BNZ9_9MICO|nr:lipopolysaccharide 1,2-N-acetylglucosaminetransferase [Dermatophilus congolensis]